MKIHFLTVTSAFSLLSISSSCNVASWGYSSSYNVDYGDNGPQVGFGYSPGFFGYTGGFGLGSLGLLMALLMSRRPHPQPRVVHHHHHHHYYQEKPGGGFDYRYKHEGPKWQQSYDPSNPSGAEARGPKSDGPFSSFFKNMFHRR